MLRTREILDGRHPVSHRLGFMVHLAHGPNPPGPGSHRAWPTVPEAVVAAADRVDFIDMTRERLRARIARGGVLLNADLALGGLYTAEHLGALGRLALGWLDERDLLDAAARAALARAEGCAAGAPACRRLDPCVAASLVHVRAGAASVITGAGWGTAVRPGPPGRVAVLGGIRPALLATGIGVLASDSALQLPGWASGGRRRPDHVRRRWPCRSAHPARGASGHGQGRGREPRQARARQHDHPWPAR